MKTSCLIITGILIVFMMSLNINLLIRFATAVGVQLTLNAVNAC